MLAGKVHNLGDLCFGHFIGKDAAFTDAVLMNVQHNLGRLIPVFAEEPLQNQNDKFHRGVVVVKQQDAVKIGAFHLWFGAGYDRRAVVAAQIIIAAFGAVAIRTHWVCAALGRKRPVI